MPLLPMCIAALLACSIALVTVAEPQDRPTASKLTLLENDAVLVTQGTYPPGAQSGMHTHPYDYRVLYTVKGGLLRLVPGDSEQPARDIKLTDGQVLYLPAATHNVINLGDTEVILVETELK